jgi:hypothetical protein
MTAEERSPLVRSVGSRTYQLCFKVVPWTGSGQDLVASRDVHDAQLSAYWS